MYTGNNPVNYIDKYGFSSLKYPGQIHDFVSTLLCNFNSGLLRERQLKAKNKNNKKARADLLKKKSSKEFYIWEIKPESTKYSAAKKQIDNYVNNYWYEYKFLFLKRNCALKKGGNSLRMFSYAPYENWLVSAYYEKDGIIRYHYEQRPKKRQKINQEVLKNILVISLLVLLALGLIVLLGGTLVFAL